MSALTETIEFYGVIALIAVLAHEPWRWLGLLLGRNVSADGEIFQWVRSVSTALVAGLVLRLTLFPAGALESVPVGVRFASLAGAIGIFFGCGRRLGPGVAGGAGLLVAGIALKSIFN